MGDAAFATPYAANISDADKIASLSELWAQAKYGFANFWHVPQLNWDQTYHDFIPKVLCTKHDSFVDGREFMGVGVQPDIPAHLTRADIIAGRDSVLETAIHSLRQSRSGAFILSRSFDLLFLQLL